jgi:hypothetical protein
LNILGMTDSRIFEMMQCGSHIIPNTTLWYLWNQKKTNLFNFMRYFF